MAPISTRTSVYATPTHKRNARVQLSGIKTSSKARSTERLAGKNSTETVGVYLRIRPLKLVEPSLIKIDEQQVQTIPPDGSDSQVYKFTRVFDRAPQSEIFQNVALPVAEEFVNSAKDGLIFTYGITGSGKTYTMEGHQSDPGLIYRTIDLIFNSIGSQQTKRCVIKSDDQNSYSINDREQLYPYLAEPETMSAVPSIIKWQNRAKETSSISVDPTAYFCLFISLIELYNKQIYDLLDSNCPEKDINKKIYDDKKGTPYVANALEIEVKSADEAVELYRRGIRRRKTGTTALNQDSSRGHCVLYLKMVQVRKSPYDDSFNKNTLVSSQLCLVDLAGSERAKRSGAAGGALHEAGNINNSLGALRKCIRALREQEPTNSIQYREYSLTRLFKTYFEGHGSVNMVLCVKPAPEDFHENNVAMDFGLLTQDVAIDYASPPKQLKRSKKGGLDTDFNIMYDYFDKKFSHFEPSKDLTDEQFISNWIEKLKSNRDRRKKYIEAAYGAQTEVRQNISKIVNENTKLKQLYESRAKDLKICEEQIENIESTKNNKIKNLERTIKRLEVDNTDKDRLIHKLDSAKRMVRDLSNKQAHYDKLYRDIATLIETEEIKTEHLRRVMQLLSSAPSAPEMEPLQSSSPVDFPNPSTSETSDSNQTPAPTTNSSADAIEHQEHALQTSPIRPNTLSSPTNGVPVLNPRHNRSLSCSSMQWIHHKPSGTIDTGTVMKPKFKNGRSVKNLRSSDILRKDAGGYSVVHQDADSNGDVETSIYKGHILSTVCGGAQVILNDIETMRQVSPKRKKRAVSDAHYTQ